MLEDMGITKRQRDGGIGESDIEKVLKSFSQVFRPVPLFEYSIGFYCRLFYRGRPSNKSFWVEVKSNTSGDRWKKFIKRETVVFWLNQLSPVFIAVYDKLNDISYWISVEDNRDNWTRKLENNAKSITLKVDKSHIFEKANCPNLAFIQKIEKDLISVNVANGIPEVIFRGGKGVTTGYSFFDFPNIELSEKAWKNFGQKIRFSMNFLIRDRFSRKNFPEAYRLCKILTEFDVSHYDHFELMGDICSQIKKPDEARTYYDTAIRMLKGDPNWDKNRVEGIETVSDNIKRIEQKKNILTLSK